MELVNVAFDKTRNYKFPSMFTPPEKSDFYVSGELNPIYFNNQETRTARKWCDQLVGFDIESIIHQYAGFQLYENEWKHHPVSSVPRTTVKIVLYHLYSALQEDKKNDFICSESMIDSIKGKYFPKKD